MKTVLIKQKISEWGKSVASLLNITSDMLSQDEIETSVRSGITFRGSQLLVLIFAIFIASLGLNADSVPVIIGAMLISPLMGPIIGMGVAIGIEDYAMLRKGLKNILLAVLGSLLASAVYFLISPQFEDSSQLLARTSPSIYDVFIALFGGAAGIVSIACKNKGQVMPGVAIATSLMPPLCTAGYGIATLQAHFFFGALYLFVTNMVFILFASWIGVKLMRFKKVVYQDTRRYKRVQAIVYTIVAITVAISVYLTIGMIEKNIFLNKADAFVADDMQFENTQVLTHNAYIKDGKKYINVTLIGEALPKDSLQLAMMNKLDSLGLGGTVLNIKQGFSMTDKEVKDGGDYDKFYSMMQTQIAASQNTIDSLRQKLKERTSFADDSKKILPEIKVLFPQVRDLALSQMTAVSVRTQTVDTINMVLVNAPGGMTAADQKKLSDYVGVRLKKKEVKVYMNPYRFPWPETNKQNKQ